MILQYPHCRKPPYSKKLKDFRAAWNNRNEASLTHGLNSCPLTQKKNIEACAPSASRQQCKLTVPLSILASLEVAGQSQTGNDGNESHLLKTWSCDSHDGPWSSWFMFTWCPMDTVSGAAAGHHGTHHKNDKEMNRTWPRQRHRLTSWQFPPEVLPDILRALRHALGTSAQGDQCCSGIEGYGLIASTVKSPSSKKAPKQTCSKLGPHPWLSERCAKNWNDLGKIFPECSWLSGLKETCQILPVRRSMDFWIQQASIGLQHVEYVCTCHISLEYIQPGGSQHH